MMITPQNSQKRSPDRQSVRCVAGVVACITASASKWTAKLFVVGGSMDRSDSFQPESNFGCNDTIYSSESNSASVVSPAVLVRLEARSAIEPSATTSKVKGLAWRPRSPDRVKIFNTACYTVAQIVRAAAANSAEFQKTCNALIAQAKHAFPEVSYEINDLMQAAILQALSCDAILEHGDAAALLSTRLFTRIRDFKRTHRTHLRLQNLNYEEMAAGLGRPNAGLNLGFSDYEQQVVDKIHRCRTIKKARSLMSGRERLALNLFLDGDKAAHCGLHRHDLRRALAKVGMIAHR